MTKISWLLTRAKQILQTEGLIALVRRAPVFVVRYFFVYETYYLYEFATRTVEELDEADFMPKLDSFTLKIVSTNEEADELEKEGLEFRSQVIHARERLDKGAIAFCIFVERELASIGWVATTQEAKDSVNRLPYQVDFSKGEACRGGVWTNPKYRRMGLRVYSFFKRSEFLWKNGTVISRGAIAKGNIVSRGIEAKFGSNKMYAEARYLKILWWKSFKEKPLI